MRCWAMKNKLTDIDIQRRLNLIAYWFGKNTNFDNGDLLSSLSHAQLYLRKNYDVHVDVFTCIVSNKETFKVRITMYMNEYSQNPSIVHVLSGDFSNENNYVYTLAMGILHALPYVDKINEKRL